MVDVSAKPSTVREATAQAVVKMAATTLAIIRSRATPPKAMYWGQPVSLESWRLSKHLI
jgi:molybdenum cofactor biosynthesis enzyme